MNAKTAWRTNSKPFSSRIIACQFAANMQILRVKPTGVKRQRIRLPVLGEIDIV